MKNSMLKIAVAIILLLSFTPNIAQIKNAKTETVKIYGNCGMCETNIEKAGNLKKFASVDWNKDTKMATLTYDAAKTSQDEILKRIALVGYDSDKFLAPDNVYANLHGCCQYDRGAKVAATSEMKMGNHDMMTDNHIIHDKTSEKMTQKSNELQTVFTTYFDLKDALVATDQAAAALESKALVAAIDGVKMSELEMDIHRVWMDVVSALKSDSNNLAAANDIKVQRNLFISISNNMHEVMKISKSDTPTYYQFCPMANDGKGANWLSKESAVKNPYYGSKMISCGKTVETIK